MPSPEDNRITYLARLNFRNDGRVFGIRRRDRRSHIYIIGKTGTGKSTLLETLIRQDIERGEGLALLDPHGDLAERVLQHVPLRRKADMIWWNVPDSGPHATGHAAGGPYAVGAVGFNPLEPVPPAKRPLAASGLLDAFKKLWADSWGPRLEHILRNTLLTLLDQPEATLADVPRLLDDQAFRRRAVLSVTNRHVADFWLREYERYPERFRVEAIAPLQNKVGAFLSNPLLSRILTQPRSGFDLRQVLDDGRILLVNLAKGKIGEDTAALLGSLLVSRISLAALSRADMHEHERRDFHLYLDEFPTFTTLTLATMLSELRKYRLNLVLAHQFLGQLDEEVRDAILGNVGTMISFRMGLADAEILEKEFYPEFTATDLVNLPNHNIYLKLMVDGAVTRPFSAETVAVDLRCSRGTSNS